MKVFLEVFAWLAEEAYHHLEIVGTLLGLTGLFLAFCKQQIPALFLVVIGSLMIFISVFLPKTRNS